MFFENRQVPATPPSLVKLNSRLSGVDDWLKVVLQPRRPPVYRWTRFVVAVGFCSSPFLLGCSVLFPSNNNEPPQPELPAHLVRANSVGYVADRVKTVTVVLPAGMTSLAAATAEVRAAAGDTVVRSSR